MTARILEKLTVAITFAVVAMTTADMNLTAAVFNFGAYSCAEKTVWSGSNRNKARHRVLDDLLDKTTPERNAYCSSSTVGRADVYGYATCDPSKVITRCDDCLSYAQDLLDDICEYAIGGHVVVGDSFCSMQFGVRPISQCAR